MNGDTYFVPKRTGSYSDVLVAYGLAALIDHIFRQVKGPTGRWQITLEDGGGHYLVRLSEPLREEWCKTCSFFSLLPFVLRKGMQIPEGIISFRDWDQERTDFFRYIQAGQESQTDQDSEGLEPAKPDFRVLDFIGNRNVQVTNPTKNGFQSYNEAVVRWERHRGDFSTSLAIVMEMFASPTAEVDVAARMWREKTRASQEDVQITCSQALNPMQGQGQNKPKANALDTRQNLEEFWLLEYLKAVGMWRCAAPQLVRPPMKNPLQRDWRKADWKVYVLAPLTLPLGAHKEAFDKFRSLISSETSLKLDVICVLLFSKSWLEYVEAAWQEEDDFDILGAPEHVVAGFHVAHFKPLSDKAYTMVNQSFLSLPNWSGNLQTRADVVAVQRIIDEHLNVTRGIDETHSDGFELLRRYRDFVSGGNWDTFLDFAVSYGDYMLRDRHEAAQQNRPSRVWQFTLFNLEELMMRNKMDFAAIVQDRGFRNVARAIRQSTVQAQYFRHQRNDRRYDIRYGLGQELARKAYNEGEFIVALGDFLLKYNAESAQVEENAARQHGGNIPEEVRKTLRSRISETDVNAVLSLIDVYGSELVAHLLVACGYSREE